MAKQQLFLKYVPYLTWGLGFDSNLSLLNFQPVSNLIHQQYVSSDHLILIYMLEA